MNNDDRKVIAWARKPGKVSLMAALGGLAGMFGTPYYGTSRGRQPTRRSAWQRKPERTAV